MEDPIERLSEAIAANRRHTEEVVVQAIRSLRAEIRSDMDSMADGLRAYTDDKFEENRRHFQVLAEDLRGEIRLVAEGVATVDAKVDRGSAELRREMASGFADLKPLFRDHERRIQALEQR